jgi:hypothetical protein
MKVIEDLLFMWQEGWGSDAIPAHSILSLKTFCLLLLDIAFVFNDSMFFRRCWFLLLLSLFYSVESQLSLSNYAIYSRDVVFVFDRQYPQIFIYPGSIKNSWYKLVFTHVEEYDANFQQKYADVEFGHNFTYTSIYHDDTVQNLNMTAFLSSGANVFINNFVYSKPTTIHYGGETVTFHASSLRFNIQVSIISFLFSVLFNVSSYSGF